ncbi:MAG: hypothetical protein PVG93_01535, partial [Phycisphaerales bacterium]
MRTARLSAFVLCCVLLSVLLTGCVIRDLYYLFKPEGAPTDKEIAKAYHLTELRKSTAADVLPLIHMPDYSLLSQSTKVLASQGQKEKGYKIWFNMVAFDEDDLLAKRKYLMISDERPRVLLTEPWEGLRFDCQMVMEGEVLEEPYSDENARRIAVMKFARQMVHDDLEDVKSDNQAFEVCGAMINQALQTVLTDLEPSPALAAKLSDP